MRDGEQLQASQFGYHWSMDKVCVIIIMAVKTTKTTTAAVGTTTTTTARTDLI